MEKWNFSPADRRQFQARGISAAQVREQLRLFEKPAFFMQLDRPATLGDGIHAITPAEMPFYLDLQEQAALAGRFRKFVPSSGAASRMFQELFQSRRQYAHSSREEILSQAAQGEPAALALRLFVEEMRRFPCYADFQKTIADQGLDLEELRAEGRYAEILGYLLTEAGLNYGARPKGLLKFHDYPEGSRTAFEEHLAEAAHYVRDRAGVCRLHFTVSPEHQGAFAQLWETVAPLYRQRYHNDFEVSFSCQKPATDTIAVDLDNRPFREKDGTLHFRPGGHGALLQNLKELQGDLVYITNIDNVVPDRLKAPVITWKKLLGGYLVALLDAVHGYLRRLAELPADATINAAVMDWAREKVGLPAPAAFPHWPALKQRDFLLRHLNRPLRVCGVVKNQGEPGGGPFWARGRDGALSLQIVESAQLQADSPGQVKVWCAATHFNPVDLVCALRDYQGAPFALERYVDHEAVFISQKSKDGRELKALELPGLWNGAMAHWLTIMVEVPLATFNPVKTLFDLLRPQHQP